MYKDLRGVDYAICPYDSNHRIDKLRMAKHVLKCAKNYPIKFREECPYNASHLMPPSEFHRHVVNCPDSIRLAEKNFHLKKHGSLNKCPRSDYEDDPEIFKEKWESDDETDDFEMHATHFLEPPSLDFAPRRPRGYPAQVLLDFDDQCEGKSMISASTDDLASIRSSICMGRGKSTLPNVNVNRVGRRGLAVDPPKAELIHDSDDDYDENESVVSGITSQIAKDKDDTSSIRSSNCLGRGKLVFPNVNTKIGRKSSIPDSYIAEQLTDFDDAYDDDNESVVSGISFRNPLRKNDDAISVSSSMGFGRGRRPL